MDIRNKILKYLLPFLMIGTVLQSGIDLIYIKPVSYIFYLRMFELLYFFLLWISNFSISKQSLYNILSFSISPVMIILHSFFSEVTQYKVYWYGGWIEHFLLLIIFTNSFFYLLTGSMTGFLIFMGYDLLYHISGKHDVFIVIGFYYTIVCVIYSIISWILAEVDRSYNLMDNLLQTLIEDSEHFLSVMNLDTEVIKQNYNEKMNTSCALCYSKADYIKDKTNSVAILFRQTLNEVKLKYNR